MPQGHYAPLLYERPSKKEIDEAILRHKAIDKEVAASLQNWIARWSAMLPGFVRHYL